MADRSHTKSTSIFSDCTGRRLRFARLPKPVPKSSSASPQPRSRMANANSSPAAGLLVNAVSTTSKMTLEGGATTFCSCVAMKLGRHGSATDAADRLTCTTRPTAA